MGCLVVSYRFWRLLVITLIISGLLILLAYQQGDSVDAAKKYAANFSVPEVSRQITVRIISDFNVGSGAIVRRDRQLYTVLTNEHVVDGGNGQSYQILTVDGQLHPAKRVPLPRARDLDLAILQFSSSRTYRVAAIGNSQDLQLGDPVYATGFPNWYWHQNISEDTRNWGLRAFRATRGQVGMILGNRSLQRGYKLGYTNDVENGMSGGPVVNKNGQLVGINGRLKYPFDGINMFAFADGTLPSVELFQQMEALSWAIPIETFLRLFHSAAVRISS